MWGDAMEVPDMVVVAVVLPMYVERMFKPVENILDHRQVTKVPMNRRTRSKHVDTLAVV